MSFNLIGVRGLDFNFLLQKQNKYIRIFLGAIKDRIKSSVVLIRASRDTSLPYKKWKDIPYGLMQFLMQRQEKVI